MPIKAVLVLDNASKNHWVTWEELQEKTALGHPKKNRIWRKWLVDVLKSINIKDFIYMVAKSFEEVASSIIIKSWRKAWPECWGCWKNVDYNLLGTQISQMTM